MAHGESIKIADSEMEYITFGKGRRVLVMLPGVGDGFKTVKGTAVPFSLLYHKYSRDFTVYVFSRRERLPEGFNNRQMAQDTAAAFEKLGIEKACVLGVSQGGMIAQWLAVDHPELVEKLILCVTTLRLSEEYSEVIQRWLTWAEDGDYKSIFIDTTERSYTEKKLRGYRPFYGVMAKMTQPKSFDRFLVNARACLTHDASAELSKIACPTLIIGGEQDRIVGVNSSRILADKIPGAELCLYPEYGHGLYDEAKDFHDRVLRFLL